LEVWFGLVPFFFFLVFFFFLDPSSLVKDPHFILLLNFYPRNLRSGILGTPFRAVFPFIANFCTKPTRKENNNIIYLFIYLFIYVAFLVFL